MCCDIVERISYCRCNNIFLILHCECSFSHRINWRRDHKVDINTKQIFETSFILQIVQLNVQIMANLRETWTNDGYKCYISKDSWCQSEQKFIAFNELKICQKVVMTLFLELYINVLCIYLTTAWKKKYRFGLSFDVCMHLVNI